MCSGSTSVFCGEGLIATDKTPSGRILHKCAEKKLSHTQKGSRLWPEATSPQAEMGELLRQERLKTCDGPADMKLLRALLKANKVLQETLRAQPRAGVCRRGQRQVRPLPKTLLCEAWRHQYFSCESLEEIADLKPFRHMCGERGRSCLALV